MQTRTKTMLTLSMLGALAYLAMFFFRIPVIMFLKYDPKDVILVISGFLYGPLPALAVTAVVALVEMVTVSDTGIIGLLMNIIASAAFVCPAAVMYKRKRSLSGAVIGLIVGCLCMTSVMLLWNYFLVPLYMGMPRQAVAALLLPAFLPFNLLKSGLNAAVTMLLYKPVSVALRRANLHNDAAVPESKGRFNIGVALASGFVIICAVLLILIFQGKI